MPDEEVYTFVIYNPNLKLGIAVIVREREHRGNTTWQCKEVANKNLK